MPCATPTFHVVVPGVTSEQFNDDTFILYAGLYTGTGGARSARYAGGAPVRNHMNVYCTGVTLLFSTDGSVMLGTVPITAPVMPAGGVNVGDGIVTVGRVMDGSHVTLTVSVGPDTTAQPSMADGTIVYVPFSANDKFSCVLQPRWAAPEGDGTVLKSLLTAHSKVLMGLLR